jgi:hypothetical protein
MILALQVLNKLPDEWVDKMNPPLHMLLVLQRVSPPHERFLRFDH